MEKSIANNKLKLTGFKLFSVEKKDEYKKEKKKVDAALLKILWDKLGDRKKKEYEEKAEKKNIEYLDKEDNDNDNNNKNLEKKIYNDDNDKKKMNEVKEESQVTSPITIN